eukprot:TRINITY_DN1966_c0_g1_i1.p1 TRINITY_DN1966_c0_g1~~TRINITY_DN1966_c0_g1_i1.p1  ORF type:complete len:263 (-),score=93.51 TRINITY_DN1966_c0_g1_i1:184-972(-)
MAEKTEIKAFLFDYGGVIGRDMNWKRITDRVQYVQREGDAKDVSDKDSIVEAARSKMKEEITRIWNIMKVEKDYPSASFFKNISDKKNPHLSFQFPLNGSSSFQSFVPEEETEEIAKGILSDILSFDDTIRLIKRIKEEKKYTIGVLSNHTCFWFNYIREKFDLDSIFPTNALLSSSYIGAAKPNLSSYEIAFGQLKKLDPSLLPQQVIFVDDKPANTKAAQQFGLQAITFNASHQDVSFLLDSIRSFSPNFLQDWNSKSKE